MLSVPSETLTLPSCLPFQAVRQKRLFWKTQEAEEFYQEHRGRFYYDRLIAGMTR